MLSKINEARKLLYLYLDENAHEESEQWIFVYKHSLRVESYISKLCKAIGDISKEDVIIARLSAIFHDIGYLKGKSNHAFGGSKMFLELSKESDLFEGIDVLRISENIKKHSDKNILDEDITTKLLKDADVLDQIGAMSILAACKKYNYSDKNFYTDILTYLESKEIEYCTEQYKLLQLSESKELLSRKVKFIQLFSSQLKDEIIAEIEEI